MTIFATEHPWLVVALGVLTLMVIDNMIGNICKAVAKRRGK